MPFSPWLRAAAQAFVPFWGPLLTRWLANFSTLDLAFPSLDWPSPGERVWILSPHPDDETLGCGGLLARCAARGVPAKIVFLTGGDGTRTTQLALRFNPRFPGPYDLLSIARERQVEARNAARALGLEGEPLEFLGFPDGGMETIWQRGFSPSEPYESPFTTKRRVPYENARSPQAPFCRVSILRDLVASLCEFQPTLVLTTPAFDTHRDHVAAFHFLRRALEESEVNAQFWTFLIHHGIWPVPNGFHPEQALSPPAHLLRRAAWHTLELGAEETETKRRALACHATQMASTPRYLNAFVRANELFCPVEPSPRR